MENLSIFDKETLEILRQLEYYCDKSSSISVNEKGEKHIKVLKMDYSAMRSHSHIDIVQASKYLQKNGVDFHLNEDGPYLEVRPGFHMNYGVEGIIKGESVEEITAKVKGLIHKLNSKTTNTVTNITYNLTMGVLIFDDKNKVSLEGKQRDVTSYLVENNAWKRKVSVGDLYDFMKEEALRYDELSKPEKKKTDNSIRLASNEVNLKSKKFLNSDKKLISYKEKEFWLEHEVKMDKD